MAVSGEVQVRRLNNFLSVTFAFFAAIPLLGDAILLWKVSCLFVLAFAASERRIADLFILTSFYFTFFLFSLILLIWPILSWPLMALRFIYAYKGVPWYENRISNTGVQN